MDYLTAIRAWREAKSEPHPWWMREEADTPEPKYDPVAPRGVSGVIPPPTRGKED